MSVAVNNSYRWARITPDDHSGTLYIVTFLGFTYTSLTFLTRILIKWHMLGLDDMAMLVAQVLSSPTPTMPVDELTKSDNQHYSILATSHFSVSWTGKILRYHN